MLKAKDKLPNIILLMTDEMEHRDLGFYGGDIPTPSMDRLFEEGMRFTRAYTTASMCTPSRFSLLTGVMPGRCRGEAFVEDFPVDQPYSIGWNTHIEPGQLTLPRLLSAAGYTTGMVGKWHIGREDLEHFDLPILEADADLEDPEVNRKLKQRHDQLAAYVKSSAGFDHAASVMYMNFDNHPVTALHKHNFPWITKGALDFIESHANSEKPFFLYMAPTAVHGPNHREDLEKDVRFTPEGVIEGLEAYNIDQKAVLKSVENLPNFEAMRYAGVVNLDHQLNLVLSKLESLGIADNTIILYLADHNIEPGKATCFEKGTHVPMAMRWPSKLPPHQTHRQLISSVDVLPTLVSLANIALPDNARFDGKDQSPSLFDPSQKVRNYVFAEAGYTRSISDGNFKYIAVRFPDELTEAMKSGDMQSAANYLNRPFQGHSRIAIEFYPAYFDVDQLYDLVADPYEQHNLANDPAFATVFRRLKTRLFKQLSTFEHPFAQEADPFYETERYRELCAITQSKVNLKQIEWYERDHGEIIWPPQLKTHH